MKGFPNQVANLQKLSLALKVSNDILKSKKPSDYFDDDKFGEALVLANIIKSKDRRQSQEEYLKTQRAKSNKSDQGHRTLARGLRELYRIVDLVDEESLEITELGLVIVKNAVKLNDPLTEKLKDAWRSALLTMTHGEKPNISSPYKILLRLIQEIPNYTRAKSPLALEAKDNSDAEFKRIKKLFNKSESDIINEIKITKSNWDNAKKILASFAEQLGDIEEANEVLSLKQTPDSIQKSTEYGNAIRRSRKNKFFSKPRKVDENTIAVAGTIERFDEKPPIVLDPAKIQDSKNKMSKRLSEHNKIVKQVAKLCTDNGAKQIYEDPMDCLAEFIDFSLLFEVKSAGEGDDVERAREALSQLFYYEHFNVDSNKPIFKIALFGKRIQDELIRWLRNNKIDVAFIDANNKPCLSISTENKIKSVLKGFVEIDF